MDIILKKALREWVREEAVQSAICNPNCGGAMRAGCGGRCKLNAATFNTDTWGKLKAREIQSS
ncbi:uncharacterized protein G2W53_012102 [Senna tora]|uniref:Uncharacterized protein n=1 Tax=Senna tora TaxID=362788 RepID=A0A834U3L0_9FABA|nr:uncharacterized protein G2W53_012102 [Senna tora]